VLAEADVILVIDSDVPWIPAVNRPAPDAAIYYVDIDPLKSQVQLWDFPARRFAAANSKLAVEQIARFVRDLLARGTIPGAPVQKIATEATIAARRAAAAARHQWALAKAEAAERPREGAITTEYLTACVSDPGELPQVLKDALDVVHGGRSAVVSVRLPRV
jgi:acetolactate synthase-1/2/3 large subunit